MKSPRSGISPNPLHIGFHVIPRFSKIYAITIHQSPRGLQSTNPLKMTVFWLGKKYHVNFLMGFDYFEISEKICSNIGVKKQQKMGAAPGGGGLGLGGASFL